jgi:hypothetical protein
MCLPVRGWRCPALNFSSVKFAPNGFGCLNIQRKSLQQTRHARCLRRNRRQQSVVAVLPLQLIHQALEMAGQFGSFGVNVLLQPFTDATANRSAGSAIDLFAALVDSVGHRGFRPEFVAVD